MAKKQPTGKPAPLLTREVATKVISIDDLVNDPANLRVHDERNRSGIEASLLRFGPARSIVVDGKGVVRAGNGTLDAARRAGITDVLVIEPEPGQIVAVKRSDWSASEATAYSIADNHLTDQSVFDDPALAKTLRALQSEDFDLGAVGFTAEEIDELCGAVADGIAGADSDGDAPEAQVDRAEELREKWGTERGQLWLIASVTTPGREHRLLCGDCRNPKDVSRLCPEKVRGVFTSPPYAEQRKEQYGGVPADQYVDWWEPIQANARSVLSDDGSFFVNIKAHCEEGERSLYVMDLVLAMKRRWAWMVVDEFAWVREGVPGRWANRFANGFEPVHHFSRNSTIKFNPHAVAHESDRVFGYSSDNGKSKTGFVSPTAEVMCEGMALPRNVIKVAADKSQSQTHSAAFPVGLPSFFIKAFSDPSDAWLEPFSGSGSTLVAAEQTGRLCRGIEIAPKYVAVALERLSDMGLEPRLKAG